MAVQQLAEFVIAGHAAGIKLLLDIAQPAHPDVIATVGVISFIGARLIGSAAVIEIGEGKLVVGIEIKAEIKQAAFLDEFARLLEFIAAVGPHTAVSVQGVNGFLFIIVILDVAFVVGGHDKAEFFAQLVAGHEFIIRLRVALFFYV